eukprot:8492046-Pyramimonas_sp.AAC.1
MARTIEPMFDSTVVSGRGALLVAVLGRLRESDAHARGEPLGQKPQVGHLQQLEHPLAVQML